MQISHILKKSSHKGLKKIKKPNKNASKPTIEDLIQYIEKINDAAEIGDISDLTSIANELNGKGDGARRIADELFSKIATFDFEGIKEFMADIKG